MQMKKVNILGGREVKGSSCSAFPDKSYTNSFDAIDNLIGVLSHRVVWTTIEGGGVTLGKCRR